ncbi:MAG TPA: type II secretion system protein [Lachnospiraceae bacterium]|nr:type II secretion system protein [Lachnospiraceae bacterium]
MQKLWKWHKENKGLTFIELVCAVAIFSLIGATICSVMIISAKNYQRDSNEIELQQEAQLTVNQIQDLVMDATKPVKYYCTVGGTTYECLDEDDAIGYGALSQGDRTLEVVKGDRRYVIAYLSSSKQIQYSEYIAGPLGDTQVDLNQLMAENVTAFFADLKNFAETGNLSLNLSLDKNDRSYASSYTITARNEYTVSSGDVSATIITNTEIVLEPQQTINLDASVIGAADTSVSWSMDGNICPDTKVYKNGLGIWQIYIGKEETASDIILTVKSNVKKANGVTPQAQEQVTVHVRRVTGITLDVTLLSGTVKQAGAVYRVTATVGGNNLDRVSANPTDNDYINPKTVKWTCEYLVSGVTAANQNEYYTLTPETDTSFKLKLNKTIQSGDQLMITALAKHPEGSIMGVPTNKKGLKYATIFAYYPFSNFYHPDLSKVYRGSDENQGTLDVSALKDLVKLKTGIETDQIARYYRFREVSIDASGARTYGAWTNWAPMTAESGNALNLRPNETYRFRCDKDYELQIWFFVYNGSESNRLWPFTSPQEANVNIIDAELDRVKVAFDSSVLGLNNARTCGSQTAPAVVSCNNEIDFKMVTENLSVWGFNFNHNQNCLMMKVEKLIDGTWVGAANSDYSLNITGITQTQKVTLKQAGTYRVNIGLKDIPYRIYDYTTHTVSDTLKDYWIGNEANGDGIFYIEAQ